ncbi:MAG: response regulator [Clostridium sp.]|nr:response regulator [Clostridium sp.]
MIQIIVVMPKAQDADSIRRILMKSGYANVFAVSSGAKAVSLMQEFDDGIVVSGFRMVDMMYSDVYADMPAGFQMLLLASRDALSTKQEQGMVCLSMPLKVHELLDTLQMMSRGILRRRKKTNSGAKGRSEEERRLIQEAKALLMTRNHMTEEEAHRYIQKCSMDSGTNLVETAQMVLAMMH